MLVSPCGGPGHAWVKRFMANLLGISMGFLGRLRRNQRGNALMLVAAGLIPMLGLIGGGVDMSRLYLTKSRVQQACDAGALAGRKAMGGGAWAYNNNAANTAAENMFNANFLNGAYGTGAVTKSFTESGGRVQGTASVPVPMVIMRVFGFTNKTITVTCDAEMRLPNTDMMFVLDVTGSMASKAVSTDTDTKIEALRTAVKCFYEIVARLDTDANCDGGAPSGGTSSETQIRFGFVPYDMNVNVGRLLPTNFFVDNWRYQTRERGPLAYGTFSSFESTTQNAGSYSAWTSLATPTATNSNACNNIAIPADEWIANGTPSWPDSGTETDTTWRAYAPYSQINYRRSYNSSTKTCLQSRQRSIERRTWYNRANSTTPGAFSFKTWTYGQRDIAVSALKSGTSWNNGMTLPIGNNWTDATFNWDGCIEERSTVRQSTYSPIPSGARDLDIDTAPTAGDPDSLWKPALGSAVYARKLAYTDTGNFSMPDKTTFFQSYSKGYTCPTVAKKLAEWSDPDAFDTYVDNMWGGGNTYHDIGLLWGARLMSPTGIFASENAFTPAGGEIQRHMIFMTDGESCTDTSNYQAYGVAWFDRRQTDPSVEPTEGCNTTGTLTQQVNERTAALCTAIKNKNITLWVVWFGAANSGIEGRMRTCASTDRFFTARNSAALQQTFRNIANQISQLRLTS
ncbi:ubiquitin-activating E1 FCCH domain-containing protein [soil metagenome]